jgi:hypothetical protein
LSPKNIDPPDAAEPMLWVVTMPGLFGDPPGVGMTAPADGGLVAGARGRVSNDRVRKHDARTRENDDGTMGSWVDV